MFIEGIDSFQTGFKQAMEMIGNEFLDQFQFYIRQWWPARALLEQAIAKRFEVRSFHAYLSLLDLCHN